MISYAQNAEDVILARAFRDTPVGYYVDVGAASPNDATVTRHFYEAGWRGINIEPLPEWAAELRQARVRDVNLEVACAAEEGDLTLFRVREDPSLSTLDREVAEAHGRSGMQVEELHTPIRTLNSILDEHAPKIVDFLKIDVEGAEFEVLKGLDLTRWRPRVIVMEATLPTTLVPNFEDFDGHLVSMHYVFAATDGINRYYARAEEAETLVPLLVPANATDDYVFLREYLLAEELVQLRAYIHRLEYTLEHQVPSATSPVENLTTTLAPKRSKSIGGTFVSLDRVAICATPLTGGAKLATLFGRALGVTEEIAFHPADVRFADLPDSCVLELPWGRTEKLRATLLSHAFQVVTVVRHPLDTLLSYLRLVQIDRATARYLDDRGNRDQVLLAALPTSEAFVNWAASDRAKALLEISASWAADPAVLQLRYDEFVADPATAFAELLRTADLAPRSSWSSNGLEIGSDLEAVGGGWRSLLPRTSIERLSSDRGEIAKRLGLDGAIEFDRLPTEAEAERNWQQIL